MRMSRALMLSFVVACAGAAFGADVAKGFKRHKLAGDTEIHLPKQWPVRLFPMPYGMSDYRIMVDDMRTAITAIVYEEVQAEAPSMADTTKLLDQVMGQYLPGSKDAVVVPVPFTNGKLIGVYATLASKTGQPAFQIFEGEQYACVSTAIVKTPKATYSISIGSGACEGEAHKTALAAISGMQFAD